MNIVITGGSRGIGKAIAEKFNKAGNTLLLCSRNINLLELAASELQQKNAASIKIFAADLSQTEEVLKFANFCLEQGTPDILVNNAGLFISGKVHNEADGQLERMLNINLFSAYHLTRAVLPAMIKNRSGHIFNICSVASLQPYNEGGSYSISKYALKGFSENLRYELREKGIKVTAVYPGAVMTESWTGFDNSQNRIMEVSDIAEMIYTASKLSAQAVVENMVIRPQLGEL